MVRGAETVRRRRAEGWSVEAIAENLRREAEMNPRVGFRLAHGWSQRDVADRWNQRWPDDPKTFKNISYWERYPSPTGHAPSLAVLTRLAELYACSVSALVADLGDSRRPTDSGLLARLGAIDSTVVRALADADDGAVSALLGGWVRDGVEDEAAALALRKLAVAASRASAAARSSTPVDALLDGHWASTYEYPSTGRGTSFVGEHRVIARQHGSRLLVEGRSEPSGSDLIIDLAVEGSIATGTWREHTRPSGYYEGAVYLGSLQLVIEPSARRMRGAWLGFGRDFVVNHGSWTLDRVS